MVGVAAAAALAARCAGDGRHATDTVADAARYAVWRLALDTLFNGREHARRLVLWASDRGDGPVLDALGAQVPREPAPRAIDIVKLSASLPARVMRESELEALFRRYPDAWAAFYRENPGAAGLVELSPVRVLGDARAAEAYEVYVGRSCGEHCRNAWRIVARRDAAGTWRVDSLAWVVVAERRRGF